MRVMQIFRHKTKIFFFALGVFWFGWFCDSHAFADSSPPPHEEILNHVRDDMLVLPSDPAACADELYKTRRGKNQCKDQYAQWYTKEEYAQENDVDEPVIHFQKNGTEVLRISFFGNHTEEDFQKHVLALQKNGARSYILDLQYNGGGFLASALKILYLFAKPADVLVTLRYRGGKEEVRDVAFIARKYDITVSPGTLRSIAIEEIWVNGQTASAGEVVAGVLQEWGYRVVGSLTFGKGVGQTEFEFSDGSVLSLTTFEVFLGSVKTKLNGVGVHPNRFRK